MVQSCIIEIDNKFFRLRTEQEAICEISFLKEPSDLRLEEQEKTPLMEKTILELNEYFSGKRKIFDLPVALMGTEFQKRVWTALQTIPYGETRSYKQIAEMIGDPKACRAVGMANNRNPIPIIIPCHRVIGSNGDLVGYAGGLELKKSLLQLEKTTKQKMIFIYIVRNVIIMQFIYKTKGTCSRVIKFNLEGNIVSNIVFEGGCNGNLKAVSALTDGCTVEFIEEKCKGIICGIKETSCADQLAKAVRKAFSIANV